MMPMADPVLRFLEAARLHADRPAVVSPAGSATYAELRNMVERLSAALAESNGDGVRVLIDLPQGLGAYAGMLGTLMARGTYSTVNRDTPALYRQQRIRRFEPHAVITDEAGRADLAPSLGQEIRILDPMALPDARLKEPTPSDALAYVLFTSGSTGEPKGVEIGRAALAHYVDWAIGSLGFGPEDRVSQHPNLAFDVSVTDVYGALCTGAALYPLGGPMDRLMPARAIRKHRLTVWNSVPSVIDLMAGAGQLDRSHLESLRFVNMLGEPFMASTAQALRAANPTMTIQNTYGPTEATVSCTALRLDDAWNPAEEATVALGAPIFGMSLLLDDPNAGIGELLIAGPQVADGYWRDPETTAAAFSMMEVDGIRQPVYRTGDLAEYVGPNLHFRGRRDRQVKIRGHRLELAEVEEAMRLETGKPSAAVVEDGVLHGFVQGSVPEALRDALARRLPDYAIPAHLHEIDTLPKNNNDKTDAKMLQSLAAERLACS